MGSKTQGKASAAWAANAKKMGKPTRQTQRCPIGHSHAAPVGNAFVNHLNVCLGPRRKGSK